jgi:hypothetical protein
VFQVTQAAVDYPRGTAGYSRGEIILFDQQRMLAGARALPRYGDTVDAPADYHHLKVLAFEGRSGICG